MNPFGMTKRRPMKSPIGLEFDSVRLKKCSIFERSIVFDWQNGWVSSIIFDCGTQSKSIQRWKFDWVRLPNVRLVTSGHSHTQNACYGHKYSIFEPISSTFFKTCDIYCCIAKLKCNGYRTIKGFILETKVWYHFCADKYFLQFSKKISQKLFPNSLSYNLFTLFRPEGDLPIYMQANIKPPNLGTFAKSHLGTIWCGKSLFISSFRSFCRESRNPRWLPFENVG